MIRSFILGAVVAPLGALLPLAALLLLGGILSALFAGNPLLVVTALVQICYGLFAVYLFGWPIALLIGAGNALVWALARDMRPRLLLSLPVGMLAVLLVFGWMLEPSQFGYAWPAFLGYCALAAFGSLLSMLIAVFSALPPPTEHVVVA